MTIKGGPEQRAKANSLSISQASLDLPNFLLQLTFAPAPKFSPSHLLPHHPKPFHERHQLQRCVLLLNPRRKHSLRSWHITYGLDSSFFLSNRWTLCPLPPSPGANRGLLLANDCGRKTDRRLSQEPYCAARRLGQRRPLCLSYSQGPRVLCAPKHRKPRRIHW